jgi:hypothetical protein
MRLYHTTLRYNLPGINSRGLSTAYSQGKLRAVWLHTEERTAWAFLHCVRRHGGKVEDIVTLEVDVDEEDLKRSSADQLFYTLKDVPTTNIIGMRSFSMVSESPLEGSCNGR